MAATVQVCGISRCCVARDLRRLVILRAQWVGPSAAVMCVGYPGGTIAKELMRCPSFGAGKRLNGRPRRKHTAAGSSDSALA